MGLGFVEPTETGAIIPLGLPLGINFNNTSGMIQLLNMKGVFASLLNNDANMNLINIIRICASYTIPGVDWEALKLRLFLFSLTGEAILSLGEFSHGSITLWNKLQRYFLDRFFPLY